MNSSENKNAVNYVISKIHSLLGGVEVILTQKHSLNYTFHIPSHKLEIIFGRATMEDFQVAIEKYRNSDQYQALENFINFRIYITLGQTGLIPKFLVAHEFLKEKRDWLQNYNGELDKSKWLYETFNEGLKMLSAFLDDLVAKYEVTSDGIHQEQEDIKQLVDFYENEHHFTERRVSVNNLGYFKAAAVCVLLRKEKEKKSIVIPRILQTKDQEIYKIVTELRKKPFPQIKMPDCIYDYAEHVKTEANDSEGAKVPTRDLVFIACGQSTPREKTLGVRVKALFKKNKIDSFLAETANDLESLNTHIFKNLADCTSFLAILHKRDKNKHNTSVWINQEVAVAAYLRSTGRVIPSLVLYEENTIIEGLIKYTIANPPTFKSDDEALSKIEEWIKRQTFKIENRQKIRTNAI